MTRTEAREFMMKVFFQMESCGDFDINSRTNYLKDKPLPPQEEYCREMFSLLCNKKGEVDELIERYSSNWRLARIPKTDLAILRVAICEILYDKGIPAAVSVNEAVELAKTYGTEESARYVNGILGKVVREVSKSHE